MASRDTGIVDTDYQFTGQKQDVSGLVYINARFFDPLTGMFVSRDTIVPDAGNVFDWNRYMYVQGRVMNANDPSGHECELAGDDLECVLVAPGQQTSEIEQLNEIRAEMEAEALAAEVQAEAEWTAIQQGQIGTSPAQPTLTNAAGIEVTAEGIPVADEIGSSCYQCSSIRCYSGLVTRQMNFP